MQPNKDNSLPANVTEAVEPGFCVLARARGVKAPLARLVKERSVVFSIIWVI